MERLMATDFDERARRLRNAVEPVAAKHDRIIVGLSMTDRFMNQIETQA
jgi:hypothetical protein